jgi:hypothetical protein
MDYEKAASFWEEKDAQSKRMDKKALMDAAEKFIAGHNTCALAAAGGGIVRCTPIEYSYRDGCFWMFSEGGMKFRALKENKNVCLAIYDGYNGFGGLGGMQVTGTAELVEPWSAEYKAAVDFKKIPHEALRGIGHTMYLIKVTPACMDFLNSDFKKEGFDSRQHIDF